jgi:folate-binding protein YgfZ
MKPDWIGSTETTDDLISLTSHSIVVSVLSDRCVLAIEGPDSAKFLQGQLTCNMQDISAVQTRRGAHCTHKGRMVADFQLMQLPDQAYLFLLPTETLSAFHKSLAKYIVFSKAKLRDASDDFLLLGISGPTAKHLIGTLFGGVPSEPDALLHSNSGAVIRITQAERFLCLIPAAQAPSVYATLASHPSIITDGHYWNWLNICDGIGDVRQETIEAFTPQMLNMQLINGISFSKGCYTGQEIVARMQYRGTLKKAMQRMAGEGTAPAPNTPVYSLETEQAVGHIVIAENITSSQWQGLVVINSDAYGSALRSEGGTEIQSLSLPYAIPTGDEKR